MQNIETANAIEALACQLAFQSNGWQGDRRLRGVAKLRGKDWPPLFSQARQRRYYVSQPMRMATGQPLLALGLVDARSERFNAYALSNQGQKILASFREQYPKLHYAKDIVDSLCHWVVNERESARFLVNLEPALNPLAPLPVNTLKLLEHCIRSGDDQAKRRHNVLAWIEQHNDDDAPPGITEKPSWLQAEHWRDIETGSLFFQVRDAAWALLEAIEERLGNLNELRVPSKDSSHFEEPMKALGILAHQALEMLKTHDPTPQKEATAFCRECVGQPPAKVIENLVRRDDRVLRLSGTDVVPGPAFRKRSTANLEADGEEAAEEEQGAGGMPSRRIYNMWLLWLDLNGKLDNYWGLQDG